MRDRGLLQAIVVLLFGGLRPNAEMLKLEWDDIQKWTRDIERRRRPVEEQE